MPNKDFAGVRGRKFAPVLAAQAGGTRRPSQPGSRSQSCRSPRRWKAHRFGSAPCPARSSGAARRFLGSVPPPPLSRATLRSPRSSRARWPGWLVACPGWLIAHQLQGSGRHSDDPSRRHAALPCSLLFPRWNALTTLLPTLFFLRVVLFPAKFSWEGFPANSKICWEGRESTNSSYM